MFLASLNNIHILSLRLIKRPPVNLVGRQEKLQALDKEYIWDLVTLPRGKQAIGFRWVYKQGGSDAFFIERYKRLVAKGGWFSQESVTLR